MSPPPAGFDSPPDDPVFLNTRHEFSLIVGVWAACLLWVVPYCYLYGYDALKSPEDLQTILGMPDWVVWGIAVPWLLADLATIAICLWVIQDDDLEPHDP